MSNIAKCHHCEGDVKNEDEIVCTGPCGKSFHLKCAGVSPRDYKILKSVEGCKWFCNNCRHYLNFLNHISKEFKELKDTVLLEINEVKNKIRDNGNKEMCLDSKPNKSFASILKSEAIVIKPKSKQDQDSSKTKEIITRKLNPCTMEVGITQIKDVKDGGILIKCKTKEEIEKLKEEAEKNLGRNFQVSTPEKKNPCIKVVDFQDNMSNEELEECIVKQNDFLREKELTIKVVIIKKMLTRYMAIIECDPATHEKILQEGCLSIGWEPACRVFDYVHVFRCFQCGGFGHGAKECKNAKVCSKCCSLDHDREECTSDFHVCRNCKDVNNKFKLNLDTDHSMYDINKCSIYKKQFNTQKQKIKVNTQ